jgi:hypothetical protein
MITNALLIKDWLEHGFMGIVWSMAKVLSLP